MQHRDWIVALACLAALAACAKGGGNAAANSAAAATGGATTVASTQPAGSACDRKLITSADVQPLLGEPISTVEPLAGDPQSCVFKTANFSTVTVGLRPGMGKETLAAWRSGQMNSAVTTLPGVGDDAVWQAELKEVNASKNDVLCDVGAMGPATKPATPDKVGAICAKIFAAM